MTEIAAPIKHCNANRQVLNLLQCGACTIIATRLYAKSFYTVKFTLKRTTIIRVISANCGQVLRY